MPIPVPNLPPFDGTKTLTLREACNDGLVRSSKGGRLNATLLREWCTRGCRIVKGGGLYIFPSIKGERERLTCISWCLAWEKWVATVREEEARRQARVWEACRAKAG